MRMHEGIEDAWLMHRSVSGHFGGGLFISEPINVSTWHQIRLGPLTTRGAITHRPWGLGKHLATTFLLSPPALLSTTNLFNLDWTQCLMSFKRMAPELEALCDLNIDTTISSWWLIAPISVRSPDSDTANLSQQPRNPDMASLRIRQQLGRIIKLNSQSQGFLSRV